MQAGARSRAGDGPGNLGAAPRALGRYRIVAELARGSTSVVYLAIVGGPGGFNKLFALKQLRGALASEPANVTMFLDEARLSARLSHPNVVQTLEIEEAGELPYIVMEYLDGQPLQRVIARARMAGTPLPLHMHLAALGGALEGLGYAHEATGYDGTPLRVVHRDVSPYNVFLTYGGDAKVLDFGIAQATDSNTEAQPATVRGRVAYMSPEHAAGEPTDARSDLFAVGVMMWEAVTGRRFWSNVASETKILNALASRQLPEGRESALAGAPIDLRRVIATAIAVDAQDRYESAAALRQDLNAALRRLTPHGFGTDHIGRHMSAIFVDDRARLQAAIDTQLDVVRGLSTADYAAHPIPRLEGAHATPPPGRTSAPRPAPTTVRRSTPDRALVTVIDPPRPRTTLPPPPAASTPPGLSRSLWPEPDPSRTVRPARWERPTIAALAGALGVALISIVLRGRPSVPASPARPANEPSYAPTVQAPISTPPRPVLPPESARTAEVPTATFPPAPPQPVTPPPPALRPVEQQVPPQPKATILAPARALKPASKPTIPPAGASASRPSRPIDVSNPYAP